MPLTPNQVLAYRAEPDSNYACGVELALKIDQWLLAQDWQSNQTYRFDDNGRLIEFPYSLRLQVLNWYSEMGWDVQMSIEDYHDLAQTKNAYFDFHMKK